MLSANLAKARALDICSRVSDFTNSGTDSIKIFRDAGEYEVGPPVCVDYEEEISDVARFVANARRWAHEAMYLAKLHDVTLYGDRLLVSSSGELFEDLAGPGERRRVSGMNIQQTINRGRGLGASSVKVIEEPSCLLFFGAASGQNHSHWLLQTCPQLGYLLKAGVRPHWIVVQPSIREYQYASIELLGFSRDSVVVRDPQEPVRFRELYVGYVDDQVVPDFTFHEMMIDAVSPGGSGSKFLYVARTDARHVRRFQNEADLIRCLASLGFEIVVPSVISARQEVEIFRNARLIVGPLGAGLYNVAFTRPGATLLGLSDPNYMMSWLPQIASLRGHRWGMVFGTCFMSHDPVFHGTHNNWIIDVSRTVSRIEALMKDA